MWKVYLVSWYSWGMFLYFHKSLYLFFMIVNPLCWWHPWLLRWFRWPWVQSVWQHNKGRPESLLCQGCGCSLDTSYIRAVKTMLLLCFTSQENSLYTILFDELGFWSAWLLAHTSLLLLTGYLSTFQSVLSVSEANNLIIEEKKGGF